MEWRLKTYIVSLLLHFSHNEPKKAINNTKAARDKCKATFPPKLLICFNCLLQWWLLATVAKQKLSVNRKKPPAGPADFSGEDSQTGCVTEIFFLSSQAYSRHGWVKCNRLARVSHLSPETQTKPLCYGAVVRGRALAPADFLIWVASLAAALWSQSFPLFLPRLEFCSWLKGTDDGWGGGANVKIWYAPNMEENRQWGKWYF